jgi:hypothetical protein
MLCWFAAIDQGIRSAPLLKTRPRDVGRAKSHPSPRRAGRQRGAAPHRLLVRVFLEHSFSRSTAHPLAINMHQPFTSPLPRERVRSLVESGASEPLVPSFRLLTRTGSRGVETSITRISPAWRQAPQGPATGSHRWRQVDRVRAVPPAAPRSQKGAPGAVATPWSSSGARLGR